MKKIENVAPTEIDEHIGQRIQLRRNMMGMTQKALAERCGVTFQQMQKYEKANNRIAASRLYQIGIVLESPVSFFFSGLPYQTVNNMLMPAEARAKAEASLKIAEPSKDDPLNKNESLLLINLYWKLPTDAARESVLTLMRALTGGAT
ncbi:MAG: helix-turn-helix transcriptional regulator [Proteobacteria bacterium]|nr:helix-turn-helix transcriptional regulator [Pseudomonadota bacterium]